MCGDGGGDPRDDCGGGAGALWQVSGGSNGFAFMIISAAGDARCHHGLVAIVVIRRACSCHWLACGPRYAHHLAGACHFLYGLCGSRYFVASAELDSSIEEAAMDTLCDATESVFRHYATDDHARDHFWLVTSFTLSLDDLVIASLVSGREPPRYRCWSF